VACRKAISYQFSLTAADELNTVLGGRLVPVTGTAPAPGDAVLALITDPLARPLIRGGRTSLHNRPVKHDAFHVLANDGILWILGASPRGLAQGVFALADRPAPVILPADLDLEGSFTFSHRIFSPILGGRLD